MLTPADSDVTLPAVIAALRGRYEEHVLVLTIIFHPETARIGHSAVLPAATGKSPCIVGRFGPNFTGADGHSPRPLDDLHISRRALQFTRHGKHLTIRRFSPSSRCRVGDSELFDTVELESEQVRAGVPILLGHSIVLLLRLGHSNVSAASGSGSEALLRGSSACMASIREQIALAGDSDLDVLIRGETGTGKELVATAIHRASRRAAAPLVSVNMTAIPQDLSAAALFGTARGAFTGADRAVPGYFEQAEGGIVFLDEIGDTSVQVQPQLLRALQQREIQSVGGAIRHVDVRVISATDAALDGVGCDFKAALRHRLGACEIVLPPLREHPEDIGELLLHFLQRSAAEAGRCALLPHAHSSAPDIAAWAFLFFSFLQYRWPGNVRELANFAQQLVLASDSVPILNDNLRAALAGERGTRLAASAHPTRRKVQDVNDQMFEQAMLENAFEIQRVARQLGVSRAAVYRRIAESPRYRLASDVTQEELQNLLLEHAGDCEAIARQLRVSASSLRSQLRKLTIDRH